MAVDAPRSAATQNDRNSTKSDTARSGTVLIWLWAFILSVLAFWSSMLVIYSGGSSTEFARITPSALGFSALFITVVIGACFSILWGIGKIANISRPLGFVVFWLAAYLTLTAVFFPLPEGAGMTALADYGTSWTNLILGLVLAILATLMLRTKAIAIPLISLTAVSLSTVAPLGYTLYSDHAATSDASPVLSGFNDIIVLSFDGIQHDVFDQTVREHPDLVSRLSNFRYFDNVIASSPATHASLTGVLAGNRDFKAEAQTTEDMIALAQEKGVPTKLAAAGYLVSGYGPFSHVMQPKFDMTGLLVRGDPTSELAYLLQVSSSRHFGPQVVTTEVFARSAATVARQLPIERPNYEQSIANQIDLGHGPDWDRSLLRSWDDFSTYKENLQVRGNTPASHFLHFTFTHHPVDFDSECTFRSEDKDWYDSHQSYAGLLDESVCALRSMEAVLARLDEIGAFQDNLIVVMSDHGAPVQWNDPSMLQGRKIRDNADWGYGRYLPILMVKLPGERRAVLEHDTRPAILDDLALSLCRWAKLTSCEEYDGMDLFDPHGEPTNGYFINIVDSAGANFKFDTHETVLLNRTSAPLLELDRYLTSGSNSAP